jgi:TonB family protein
MGNLETEQQFEKNKNLKALGITCAVTIAVFLIFLLVGWTLPQLPLAPKDEGVEVNLGNSDFGSGTIAPQIPGEPSEAQQTNSNPPPTARSIAETEKEVIPNNEPDATPVNTSPKPEKKKPKQVTNTITKPKPKAVINQTPTPTRRALAIYHGGKNTANGGNNADSYNNAHNQGIAGGNGDQGKPNGNPNSDSYTGNGGTGTSGISISNGLDGRRLAANVHFEDSYQYGGTVLVSVSIDANGKVTSASIQLGSPFPDINKIALRRAYQITFTKGSDAQTGTIKIKFEAPKG